MTDPAVPDDLSEGEKAILRRLAKKPIDIYYGKSGWVADRLPKPARRADFDKILHRTPSLVDIKLGQLVLIQPAAEQSAG